MKPGPDLTLDLKDLILNASSLVRLESNTYHIALHPSSLADLKSSIKEKLDSVLYKFNFKFGGFLLGYKNVKIASDRGSLINDDFFIHFNIIADFYIFSPKVGCVLYGIVNKKSADHIGCLVHKFFNVSITRPTNETQEDWIGTFVEIGHQVTFVLKMCDFTGNLPYMRGSILSSCPVNSDDAQPKLKKKMKLQCNKVQEDTFASFESHLIEISDKLAKRKREFDDESSTSKRKKKKRKLEEDSEEEHVESNSLHMSSEDPDYGKVIQDIEESYLKENIQDTKEKNVKETIRNKKRKLHTESELTDSPQKLHLEITEECNSSEQTGNKKKKHKKHHDINEKSDIVLPDLVSLMESYKSRTQKLYESLSASEKESELSCSSQNKEESLPSFSYLLNKGKKMADDPVKKKKKDKHENVNINTESQEKHRKNKKKKQDSLENYDNRISTIETTYERKSPGSNSLSKQSGGGQAVEFVGTEITPNAIVEPVKRDKSKKKQASDILHPSVLSRIASVHSDSDNSHIPEVSKGKGERNSLLSTPSTQLSSLLSSYSKGKSKKTVSFSDGDKQLSPKTPLSQLLKAKFGEEADSSITTQSLVGNTSIVKNSMSPSKPKKEKKMKSPVQDFQHLNLLKMESNTLKEKEVKGSKAELNSDGFEGLNFSAMLKTLTSKSKCSDSPQSNRAVKNIVNANDSEEIKASASPIKSNVLNITKDEGKDITDKGFTSKANVKDKHKKKKTKDKDKHNKKEKVKKKKKDSKTSVNVNAKKLKKKKDAKNSELNNIKKLSNQLLQKIMKDQGAL